MILTQELSRKEYTGTQPPAWLSELITTIGGKNEFGEPVFRLVRAEERLTPSGGVWLTWLPGTAVKKRNSSKERPWRRAIEIRMIKRYGPVQGWALEKWVPAKAYGTRERWMAPASHGGTILYVRNGAGLEYVPSQGEYPDRGDYEYTGFIYQSEQLAEETVIPAVQALIRELEALPTNPLQRIAQRAFVARQANEAAEKAYDQWAMDILDDRTPAFGLNPRVGFGEKRRHSVHDVLKRLKIGEHPGVS